MILSQGGDENEASARQPTDPIPSMGSDDTFEADQIFTIREVDEPKRVGYVGRERWDGGPLAGPGAGAVIKSRIRRG